MNRIAALFTLILFSSCGVKWAPMARIFDSYIFEHLGGTLLSKPPEVSLKIIHLEPAKIEGRLVITEGMVLDRGKYDTSIILFDDNTRLFLDTTKIMAEEMSRYAVLQKRIRVLGTVDRGRKGLPIMTVLSMSDRKLMGKKQQSIGM